MNLEMIKYFEQSYKDEYKELSDLWKEYEKKNNIYIVICGIIISFSITYLNNYVKTQENANTSILMGIIVFEFISLLIPIFGIFPLKISYPAMGTELKRVYDVLIENPMEDMTLNRNAFHEICELWVKVNDDYKKKLKIKSFILKLSQVYIILTLIMILFSIIFTI